MNGDIYRLREEMLERFAMLTGRINKLVEQSGPDIGQWGNINANMSHFSHLLEKLTERVIEAEEVSASAVSIADSALQDLEKRIAALEANKCSCGNKATPTAVKELRSALPG